MKRQRRAEDIDGLISLEVGDLLRRLSSLVSAEQVIVEIGAYKGRSTCFLASGVHEGVEIISIDPHGLPGSERGRDDRFVGDEVRQEYLDNINAYPFVRPIRELSKNVPLPELPIGLLWIDGDHSLVSVALDVERFSGLVAPGGHIVIDDYGTHHPGVNTVVNALRLDSRWCDWSFTPAPLAWARRAS